jgi:hypothetical protein
LYHCILLEGGVVVAAEPPTYGVQCLMWSLDCSLIQINNQ